MECKFAGTGCNVKVPRRDMAGHMTENAQHHLMTATLLNLRLTRELHQKMEEKDQQITELKQQMTDKIAAQLDQQKEYFDSKLQNQTETFDAKFQQQAMKLNTIEANSSFLRYSIGLPVRFTCHKLTLSEFKKFQAEGRSWFSEPFYNYPGGYRFKLNIDIDETNLSAYLYLLKGDYDDERQWPIKVTVRLTMLNQQRDNNHHECPVIEVRYQQAAGEKFVCIDEEYFPLNRLQSYVRIKYLYNDSIKFKLELKIKH